MSVRELLFQKVGRMCLILRSQVHPYLLTWCFIGRWLASQSIPSICVHNCREFVKLGRKALIDTLPWDHYLLSILIMINEVFWESRLYYILKLV